MSGSERRRAPRIDHRDQLIIKVISSSSSSIQEGRTFYCAIENASMEGLCIQTSEPIPRGSTLELWIIAKHRQGTLVLSGQVMWCKEVPATAGELPGFSAGIQFNLDPPAAIHEWRETLAELIVASRKKSG